MKYFRKIASDLDVHPCLDWILTNEQSLPFKIRSNLPSPIKAISDLPTGYRTLHGDHFGVESTALWRAAIAALKAPASSRFGPPSILTCPPRSRVAPHTDNLAEASQALGYPVKRYQLALQCARSAYFRIGVERAHFKPGELWLCDIGGRRHEMNNLGDTERIVMIFDVMLPQ
jgi:Aspartyl/Asparaginyl beta-hydroxylase